MLVSDVDAVVSALLMTDAAGVKQYLSADESDSEIHGTEILPDLLYRYHQLDEGRRGVTLQIYAGVGEVGAQLWDQEVKVLLRVANLQHPALPEVLDGGHLEASKIAARLPGRWDSLAYVRTLSRTELDADDADELARVMHGDRVWALRQFWLLADALAILHDARISHRNLWPGTLQVYEDNDHHALRINRFEMSALLSNLLRATSVDAAGRDAVRRLYLAQGRRALPYAPPERLSFLFGADDGRRGPGEGPGSAASDVFGLGMMSAEWFLGGFDAPGLDGEREPTVADLLGFQREIRRQVRTSGSVPSALGALLDDMLDPDPRGRATAATVLQRLSSNYDGVVSLMEGVGEGDGLPHLLLYLAETRNNLARWDLLDDPTDTDPRKIARVIEEDLRGALVVESPDGAERFLTNYRGATPEKLKQARWVLIGPKAAWFCRPYELRSKFSRAGELLADVYVIGYVALRDKLATAERDRLKKLEDVQLHRRIGSVHVESDEITSEVLAARRGGRPSWKTLFDTVQEPVPLSPKERSFAHAVDWLLDYQTAQLAARAYAFERDAASPANGQEVALRWRRERDRDRRDRMPPLHAKLLGDESARPSFGDFFSEVAHSDQESLSYLRATKDGGPVGSAGADLRFLRRQGEDTVIVASVSGSPVPDHGLLSPADDAGTKIALDRQRDAREELVRNRVLMNRLIAPISISSLPARWEGAAGQLRGEGKQVVIDMLCHQPMFVLQGPPGTGKTEISSQAVLAYLRADPRARVLVSAQSHFALDNLAVRILTKLGVLDDKGRPQDADFLAIRVFNERAKDRVDTRLQVFQAGDSAIRMRGMIRRRAQDRIDTRVDGVQVRGVAESWLAELRDGGLEIELGERLRRGANLVFVTCAAATPRTLVDNGAREPFDWVLIEEAAKAWPTELALPLVRGLRWTMVGDQEQIGAYGAVEVERFLDSCMNDPNPSIAEHYNRKADYLRVFELFGTMVKDAQRAAAARGDRQAGPVRWLTEQRRMRDAISQVVSRSFYPVIQARDSGAEPPADPGRTTAPKGLPDGLLVTRRDDRGPALKEPEWLAGSGLVWIDTSGMRQDEGYWLNEYEADLVTGLVGSMKPDPQLTARHETEGPPGLAVITPYRRQRDVIVEKAPELKNAVKTVDAFQGREADIVIVSLVRDSARASWDRPLRNVGHLADPSRVNVMLSRARDLLVVVGSFDHFAGSGLPEWESVTKAVTRFGIRRTAAGGRR